MIAHYTRRIDAAKAHTGTLKSSEGRDIEIIYPMIRIGSNGISMRFGPTGGSLGKVLMFDGLNDDHLKVSIRDGKLLVSTVVRDESGNLIASITDNEWKTSATLAWDRNFSDEAFEVVDLKGRVVFQIRLNRGVAQIQGIFCSLKGDGIAVVEGPNGSAQVTGFAKLNQVYDQINIKPIFKYPSEKFPGELAQPMN